VIQDFQISYKPYEIPDISDASMITPSQMASKAGAERRKFVFEESF
jgi:hypothetical protein